MPRDETELLEAVMNGDRLAEEELHLRFRPTIRRMIQYRVARLADVDDLVSEAQKAVLESLRRGSFRGDCALGTFVHAIVRNKLKEYYRAHRRVEAELSEEIPDPQPSPEEGAFRNELARAVREVVDGLAPKYRNVLYHHFFRGLTVARVAAELDVPPRKVTEWKDYALRQIRRRFSGDLDRFR